MAYKALVIGVNEYKSTAYEDLKSVLNDAEAISSILNSSSCNYDLDSTKGVNATFGNIQKKLNNFFECNYDDVLFLYWAGHGTGSSFVAYDTDPSKPNTAISLEWLKDMIENTNVETIVAVFDCCYSGAIARSASTMLNIKGCGKIIMASSDFHEESWSSQELGHGNFSYLFLEGLRGNAANSGGAITVGSLRDYISEHIGNLKSPKKQTPVFDGRMRGNVVLNRVTTNKLTNTAQIPLPTRNIHQNSRQGISVDFEIADWLDETLPIKFTDIEKQAFMKESYKAIRDGFIAIAEGIKQKNPAFNYQHDEITSQKSEIKFFMDGKIQNAIVIWLSNMFSSNIESIQLAYGLTGLLSASNSGYVTGCNDFIRCGQDEKELFLDFSAFWKQADNKMKPDEIARAIFKMHFTQMFEHPRR